MSKITLRKTDSSDNEFIRLCSLLDQELRDRNGELQNSYDQFNILKDVDTVLIIEYNKVAVGCGCFKFYDKETAEIKRMFIEKKYRGLGISKIILNELELWAKEKTYKRLVLETSFNQTEAINLYKRRNYRNIENYGIYKDMSTSICFEKSI